MRSKLRELRKNKNMTQKEMAEKIKVSRPYYTNIELGHKEPSFRVARDIKRVLEEKDDDIFLIESVTKRNNKKPA